MRTPETHPFRITPDSLDSNGKPLAHQAWGHETHGDYINVERYPFFNGESSYYHSIESSLGHGITWRRDYDDTNLWGIYYCKSVESSGISHTVALEENVSAVRITQSIIKTEWASHATNTRAWEMAAMMTALTGDPMAGFNTYQDALKVVTA